MGNTLMIGSCQPFSGKSALVLGIARRFISLGKEVKFGKPLATTIEVKQKNSNSSSRLIDDDVRFIGEILGLSETQLIASVDYLSKSSSDRRLIDSNLEPGIEFDAFKKSLLEPINGINLLEAAGSLHEGLLYGLSLVEVAKNLNIPVIIVHS